MNKKSKKENLVIIGNSGAAINAVKGIRELDAESVITIISKERHHAYAPVLTTYLISGKVDREKMMLVDKDFYERNGVRCINNKRATSIDTKETPGCGLSGRGTGIYPSNDRGCGKYTGQSSPWGEGCFFRCWPRIPSSCERLGGKIESHEFYSGIRAGPVSKPRTPICCNSAEAF